MSSTSTTPALPGVVRMITPDQARRLAISRGAPAAAELTAGPHSADISPADGSSVAPPKKPLTEELAVECDEAEVPRRLRWQDRWHLVVEEPIRWFERRRWWVEDARVERGRGPGVVDHEIWRLQIRLEAASRAVPRTVDLSRHTGSGRWRLLRVHDVAA